MADLPNIFLWAWERPEDFTQVNLPPGVGIAYLAATIHINGEKVAVAPRRQPLLVPPSVPLIAVFRVEVDERKKSVLGPEQAKDVCAGILQFTNNSRIRAVQVDFDALRDERDFYKALLQELRAKLPSSLGLSITALVSWCMGDTWMQNLPIDESVPMCFSMGRDADNVLVGLKAGQPYGDKRCNGSLGISIDEPKVNDVVVPAALGKHSAEPIRIYVFSGKPWSRALVQKAVEIAHGNLHS
jgi:hypothetical protein